SRAFPRASWARRVATSLRGLWISCCPTPASRLPQSDLETGFMHFTLVSGPCQKRTALSIQAAGTRRAEIEARGNQETRRVFQTHLRQSHAGGEGTSPQGRFLRT